MENKQDILFLLVCLREQKNVFELIHADLCGLMNIESFGGSQYFLLFTNDYSRMSWIYFLKFNSKTFENFKKFKVMVRSKVTQVLKFLVPKIVENFALMNLMFFVRLMVFAEN